MANPWQILADPITPQLRVVDAPDPGAVQVSALPFSGRGIVRPLRRDQKIDFANETGAALIASAVGQILGTQSDSETTQGELPWRTEFGSLLHLLRHRLNSHALVEVARKFVVDPLRRWEPRVRVTRVNINRETTPDGGQNVLRLRIRYDIIDTNSRGNRVLVRGLEAVVNQPIAA